MRNTLRSVLPEPTWNRLKPATRLLDAIRGSRPLAPRLCNLCGYEGVFYSFGRPVRVDAECRGCGSLERHRLFWLWYTELSEPLPRPIAHFAPETVLRRRLQREYTTGYRTADLYAPEVDDRLNLEAIDLPANGTGTVIANHVLEHVDDRAALDELYRILVPKGLLVCSVPIVEGWKFTYEDPSIVDAKDREVHFGQSDHLRYYGRDFRERLAEAGFEILAERSGSPEECVRYGLIRGEVVFVCRRPT